MQQYTPNNDLEMDEMQDEPILNVIKREYLPYWPIILVVGLLGLMCSHLYIRYLRPIYTTSAVIMFKDNNRNQTQQVLGQLGIAGQQQDKTNQNLEILKGNDVSKDALSNMKLNAQLYTYGKYISKLKPLYGVGIKYNCIFFKPDSINSFEGELTFNPKLNLTIVGEDTLFFNKKSTIAGNELLFSIEPEDIQWLNNGSRYVFKISSNGELNAIYDQLVIAKSGNGPSIGLSLDGEDPELVRDMLTNLLKSYDKVSMMDNMNEASSTIRFIEGRLAFIEKELDSVETGIEQYKRDNPQISLSTEGSFVFDQLRSSDAKLAEIELQTSLLNDVENYLKGKGSKPGMIPSFAGMQFGQEIQQFLMKLYEAEIENDKLKLTTSEKSEQYLLAQERIKALKSTILEIIVNVRRNIQIIQSQAKKEVNSYKSIISGLPSKERYFFDISRKQAIKNALFTSLLEKREESAIRAAAAASDLIVLEPPSLNPDPINIKKSLYYSYGLFGGMGLVLLIIILRNTLNDKLTSKEQIEQATRIPILGTISFQRDNNHLIMVGNSRGMIAEQFRALRTNIGYYKKPLKNCMVIVMTSSIPGEGKSFNAANLALAMAMTGEKTLLIESDLRKPNISKHFKLDRNSGLSNHLVGKQPWQELVNQTEHDHLSILSAGPIPPNPVELIMNGRYETMLKEACHDFKYIIIDCPPLGVVTDAEQIAKFADLMLFVTRYGVTPKEFLGKLVDKYNTQKKITQCGIIFNGLRFKGLGYYGYRYGGKYGYGYGYGYGSGYGYYEQTEDKKGKKRRKRSSIFNKS
jgi:tyrosine-protein kinase Etk/Wzc